MKKNKNQKAKKNKKADKPKKNKTLFGGAAQSVKNVGKLTSGQKVAGGAALLAAWGLGYWAQRRRTTTKTATNPNAAGAEQQLASLQGDAA